MNITKIEKAYTLIEKNAGGMNIALITDLRNSRNLGSGRKARPCAMKLEIEVTSLPGPAACITALTLSGLLQEDLRLRHFFPWTKKSAEELQELVDETRTIIIYEAPP